MGYERKPKKTTGFVKLGSIIETKNGLCVVLNEEVELEVNGQKVTGKFINMEKPMVKYERMLDKGLISEEEFAEKEEKLFNGKTKYELSFSPKSFE